jgi:hypothetical protein
MPLHLEYTLTAQDFAESRRRWSLNGSSIMLLIAFIMALLLVPRAIYPEPVLLNPPPPTAPTGLEAWMPLLQWLLILVVIWVPVFRMLRNIGSHPWKKARQRQAAPSATNFRISAAIAGAIVIGAVAWTIAAKRNAAAALGSAVDPTYSPVFDTLLPLTPFAVLSAILLIWGRRVFSPTRIWSPNYHLHRPFTADIDDTGLRISEPCAQFQYAWTYFRGHNQTPNLFLLYPSSLAFVMIPKRAFPTPESQQHFAALLSRHITPPTGAFPVLPLPSLPPAPPPLARSASEAQSAPTAPEAQ